MTAGCNPRRSALLSLALLAVHPAAADYRFDTCTDYHCDRVVPVALSADEWSKVEALFTGVSSPAEERARIAEAIGTLESLVGPKNGTSVDRGGNPHDVSPPGQLDCIAESMNSTAYLRRLEENGLLRWHRVEARAVRQRWVFAIHWTAVVSDLEGVAYAVDSWYGDNGKPAIVLPLEAWYRGEER
jgi:hypothetical protein